jgi:hypothetical protein
MAVVPDTPEAAVHLPAAYSARPHTSTFGGTPLGGRG